MSSDEARVARLVGVTRKRTAAERQLTGGGLPLCDAFRAICRQFLNGPVREPLVVINVARELSLQRERVAATWGTWEALTADLLAQLEYAGMALRIATTAGDEWTAGSRFRTATRLMPIPGSNLWFTVYTEEEERQRSAADEVKKNLIHSRRVLEKAGMFTTKLSDMLAAIEEVLSSPGPSAPPSEGRVRTRIKRKSEEHDKPKPLPSDTRVLCIGSCGQEKPLTEDYYELYWHNVSNGGDWYWQRKCITCRRADARGRVLERRERVRKAVITLHEQGVTPGVENVAEIAETNPRDASTDWNYLSRRNLVPLSHPEGILSRRRD